MSDDSTPPGLPAGWTSELLIDGRYALLKPSNPSGFVTIDWERRGFRGGISTSGQMTSTKTYAGRGWREQLVRDAVAWLDSVWGERPAAAQRGGAR